jgi:glycine cleavage system H protein
MNRIHASYFHLPIMSPRGKPGGQSESDFKGLTYTPNLPLEGTSISNHRRCTMNIPTNLKYTKTDEWFDPSSGAMGLTDYAQEQLSDIVFVEILLSAGETVKAGQPAASVESVKAAAETYTAVSGKVSAINEALADSPEILNSDPFGAGWMVKIENGDASALMDAAAYKKYCSERSH